MIPDEWRYLGTVSFNFDSDSEVFLPFDFNQRLVGVKASINQVNARQTWIRAGYMTQYLDTDIGVVTTTASRLVKFEPQILEFADTPIYRVKFRPVPWVLSINLAIFIPRYL